MEKLLQVHDVFNPMVGKDNLSKREWRQLIILGNGFDLQCGLRSTFRDFFTHRFQKIQKIQDCGPKTWERVLTENDLTIWDFILQSEIDSSWFDVEASIENWVLLQDSSGKEASLPEKAVEGIKENPFSYGEVLQPSDFKSEEVLLGNIARYIWISDNKIEKSKYERKNFVELLKKDLKRLEEAFAAYLTEEVNNNTDYAKKSREFYKQIESDGKKREEDYAVSTSVLSFNYTNSIEQNFDGGEYGAFVNIHGKLGEEIIFGIDGKDCMDNPEAVFFTKTFRLMRRGGALTHRLMGTANVDGKNKATHVIKIYGHSLGKADYSYFQSIFDSVNLYESNTVLVFYYPNDTLIDGDSKNSERCSKLANRVNDLLVAYGATMQNKDHGKNLMHKLIIEGRLFLRGLP